MKKTLLASLGFAITFSSAVGATYFQQKYNIDNFPVRLVIFLISLIPIGVGMYIIIIASEKTKS